MPLWELHCKECGAFWSLELPDGDENPDDLICVECRTPYPKVIRYSALDKFGPGLTQLAQDIHELEERLDNLERGIDGEEEPEKKRRAISH